MRRIACLQGGGPQSTVTVYHNQGAFAREIVEKCVSSKGARHAPPYPHGFACLCVTRPPTRPPTQLACIRCRTPCIQDPNSATRHPAQSRCEAASHQRCKRRVPPLLPAKIAVSADDRSPSTPGRPKRSNAMSGTRTIRMSSPHVRTTVAVACVAQYPAPPCPRVNCVPEHVSA